MTVTQETARHSSVPLAPGLVSGPTFTGLDILGGIVAAAMLLLPLTAAATHASHQGWPTEQANSTR